MVNQSVSNFHIAYHHTYFVGRDDWGFSAWAHNVGEGCGGRLSAAEKDHVRELVGQGVPVRDAVQQVRSARPATPTTPTPPADTPPSATGDGSGAAGVVPGRRVFLTPEEFANLPRTGTIDPMKIRFSQDSIKGSFKDGGNVHQLAADLIAGKVDPNSIPPIRLVERDGKIYTLDNRRLKAFQEAGITISYEKLDTIPTKELYKFTTINEGVDIVVRAPR
ncbi:MAG: hypothetical protein NZS48_00190 [Gemmata sp.]|nr:hypothetical protein [Gemmata sp.]